MTVKEIKTVESNPDLVRWFKKGLEQAERGELQGIVGVVVYENGNSADFWVFAPKCYHTNLISDRIIGCFERIKYQLLSQRHNVDAEDRWTT